MFGVSDPGTDVAVGPQSGGSPPGSGQPVVSGPTTTDVSNSSAKVGSRCDGRRDEAVVTLGADPVLWGRAAVVPSELLIACSVFGFWNSPSLPSGSTGSSRLVAGSEPVGPAGSPSFSSFATTSTSDPRRWAVRGNDTATTRPSRHSPIRARSPCRRSNRSARSRPVARKVRTRSTPSVGRHRSTFGRSAPSRIDAGRSATDVGASVSGVASLKSVAGLAAVVGGSRGGVCFALRMANSSRAISSVSTRSGGRSSDISGEDRALGVKRPANHRIHFGQLRYIRMDLFVDSCGSIVHESHEQP